MTATTASPLHTELDHIVVTAPTLAAGVEYVRAALGVAPQPGGEHARMGTHNALLKLGDAVYLEVIAIDPRAAAPSRSRWFRMDDPIARMPHLATWVARTTDIRAAPAALGEVLPMSRGDLHWHITVPADGSLPFDGIAPTLIQWETAVHPARRLVDLGCTLVRLEGFHPAAEAISAMLRDLDFHGVFCVSVPPPGVEARLIAHIDTPIGVRCLRG